MRINALGGVDQGKTSASKRNRARIFCARGEIHLHINETGDPPVQCVPGAAVQV